jgi:hypothetical protein
MARRDDTTPHALERVSGRRLLKPRQPTTLAALARPAGKLAGLLVLEVLQNPRARSAALQLASSLLGRLASRHPGDRATARLTARSGTIAAQSQASGVLVRRVETAIIVLRSEQSPAE